MLRNLKVVSGIKHLNIALTHELVKRKNALLVVSWREIIHAGIDYYEKKLNNNSKERKRK